MILDSLTHVSSAAFFLALDLIEYPCCLLILWVWMLIFTCFQSCFQSVSVPIPDYMFLATVCFNHRNNHLSCKNTFERLTICIGGHYWSVQFTCTIYLYCGLPVISFRTMVHFKTAQVSTMTYWFSRSDVLCTAGLYQVCSNYAPGAKNGPTPGVTCFT